jgi:hypothetical protein
LSNIFERFYTIFKRFYTVFEYFRTFSNVFERFLHKLARLVLPHFTHLPYFKNFISRISLFILTLHHSRPHIEQ